MSGLLWDLATSDTALLIVGVIFVGAMIVAHVPLIGVLPAVAPYVLLAGLVSYLALADLALCVGYRISDERAALRRLQIDLAWHENELEQQKATAEDRQRLAEEKAAETEELKGKVDDYEKRLASQPVGACGLDDGDLDGLRSLHRRAQRHRGGHPAGLRGSRGAGAAPGP